MKKTNHNTKHEREEIKKRNIDGKKEKRVEWDGKRYVIFHLHRVFCIANNPKLHTIHILLC